MGVVLATVLTLTHALELEKLEGFAVEKQNLTFILEGLEHGHGKNALNLNNSEFKHF